MVHSSVRYFADNDDQSPFIKALAEVRLIRVHEGWCYHHVNAISAVIDQYAEAATGNREFFCNKPHSTRGSRRTGDVLRSP
jgi:hypothetical protein